MDVVTVENIEKAIHQFYHSINDREQAHAWLTHVQRTPHAWTFCWQLLEKDKPQEVQFFGACCLHVKVSRYWHEVPCDQVEVLKSQLFSQVIHYASGPKMVLTRLCVALASFVLHTAPDKWPDAIPGVVSMFQQAKPPGIQFSSLQCPQQKMVSVRAELNKGTSTVLPLIKNILSQETTESVHIMVLKCFSNWVQFGIPPTEVEDHILQIFRAVHNPALFDAAIEALVTVFSYPDIGRYPNSVIKLIPHVLQLQEMYNSSLQEHDMENCQGLVKLFVTVVEHNTQLILRASLADEHQRQLIMSLLNLILHCSAVPGYHPVDEGFSDMPFGFWYILQDDILGLDPKTFQIYQPLFSPVYMSLVAVLLQKSQYPPDEEFESWTADDKEVHRCYRQDIADTLMYCYNFLREPLLHHICAHLSSLLEKSRSSDVRWQEYEAVLFCVGAVAENVDLEENIYIPSVLEYLPKMNFTHAKLVAQAVNLIGDYAEWINFHPDHLRHVIPLMLQGLKYRELGQAVTLSLKSVCGESQEHLGPFVNDILTASQEVLAGNTLKGKDCVRLMCCVGYTLSILPVDQILQHLNTLLSPHIEQLQQFTQQEPSAPMKNTIIVKLSMLSWLFSTLNTKWTTDEDHPCHTQQQGPQPVAIILQQIMPVLQGLLAKWITDSAVVEQACEMLKRAIRTIVDDFLPLFEPVSQLLIQMFEAYPNSSIIDLAKQIIIMHGTDVPGATEQQKVAAQALFLSITQRGITFLEDNSIRDNPDFAENLMTLLSQVGKKNPKMYSTEGCNLLGLFRIALTGLTVPEPGTIRSSCSFLAEFIMSGLDNPVVRGLVTAEGLNLTDKVIKAIGGDSPRHTVDHLADILLSLNKVHFDHIGGWLEGLLTQKDYPTPHVSPEQKKQFIQRILKEKVHKRRLKETVKEFTLMCRGLFGTEYGAQTQGVPVQS